MGYKALTYLKQQRKHIAAAAFIETHVALADVPRMRDKVQATGWDSYWAPGQTGCHVQSIENEDTPIPLTPCQGGTVMTVGDSYRSNAIPEQLQEQLTDLAPCILKLCKQPLLLAAMYLRPWEGLSLENRRRLGLLILLARMLNMPWIALGDLNMPPHELADWAHEHEVHIWKPDGATATCSAGQGRLLDYVLTSEPPGSDLLLGVTLAPAGTWRAHLGMQCRLSRSPTPRSGWIIRLPRPLPLRPQAIRVKQPIKFNKKNKTKQISLVSPA